MHIHIFIKQRLVMSNLHLSGKYTGCNRNTGTKLNHAYKN